MSGRQTPVARRTVLGLVGLALARPAWAATDTSEWVETGHGRLRLIDAGHGPDGATRLAGLQVELDPGFLTYWRTPGEAGVAPVADVAGSSNLAAFELLFPAPGRFDEGGTQAFGYKDGVIFPLRLTAADPRQPVDLTVALSFAVCAAQCIPARGAARLRLGGAGTGPEAGLVRDALAQVPEPRRIGAPGVLSIVSVAPRASPDRFLVTATAEGIESPALFVEAPDPWFFQAGDGTAATDGHVAFEVRALAGPQNPAKVALRLTLASGMHAIDVMAELDAAIPKP